MSDAPGARRAVAPFRPYAPRRDPPPPIWHTTQDEFKCRHGHVRIRMRDESMNVQERVTGYLYQECPKCDPPTFAFGIAATRPSVLVTWYACTKAQYHHILELPDPDDALDVLRFLGYHPPAA